MSERTAIVVGAGPAGASAAFRLHQAGYAVRWIERGEHAGGRTQTKRLDGYLIDVGAGLMPGSYEAMLQLIRDSGQAHRLEKRGCPVAIALNGQLHRLDPAQPLAMLRTPLLDFRSKRALLRLGADLLRRRSSLRFDSLADAAVHDTETLAQYANRALTPQLYENLLNPVQKALYAIPGKQASVVDAFWCLQNLLGPTTYCLQGGMDGVVRGVTAIVPLQLRTTAMSVHETRDGVAVRIRDASGHEETLEASVAVVAVPARDVPTLCADLPTALRDYLGGLRYSWLTDLHLRLRRPMPEQVLSVMIPDATERDLCGLIVEHAKGSDRAPSGKGLLTAYFMHEWSQQAAAWSDDEVYRRGIAKIGTVLPGIAEQVEGWNVERWDWVATMSSPGHYRKLADFTAQLDTGRRVQLAGDYFSLASMNSAVLSGAIAARRLLQRTN